MTNIFVKHWRLVFLVLVIIIFFWVLYLLRTVILPFAVGLVLAYLLMPAVSWLERSLPCKERWLKFKRIFSILVAFLILIALISVFFYFLVTAVIDASMVLVENAPSILSRSFYQVQEWFQGLLEQLPIEIQQEVGNVMVDAGISIGNSLRQALMGGLSGISRTFTTIMGFAVLPFFLFYIMKDSGKLKKSISSVFTPGFAAHVQNLVAIMENVLGRYIRAQMMLGLIVGYFSFIGLLILRVPFAPVLAVLAGITELIPTLGPWIGGGVAAIVTLAVAPEKTIWVIVVFLVVQLLENNLLVPRIQSAYMRIHPAAMIFLLVLGAYIAGFWGLLLVAPLTATLVEIGKYVRRHYQTEKANQSVEEV